MHNSERCLTLYIFRSLGLLPNHLNHSAFHTPTSFIELSGSASSSNVLDSPPNFSRYNAAAHALAGQLIHHSGNSALVFPNLSPVDTNNASSPVFQEPFEKAEPSNAQIEPSRPPSRLLQPALMFAQRSEAEEGVLLHRDLNNWVSAAGSEVEKTERSMVALSIVRCFDHNEFTLFINAEHITQLPKSIGLLRNLILLDLSGCRSLQSLPNVMDNFLNLERLDLTNCASLTALPPSAMAVRGFGHLFLEGSGIDITNPLRSGFSSI